ncbi:MAG TPA: peptidase M50 [Clostridiaceae bacterium]|nr:peptidase M50 [Clostridiaceae bacterium]
MFHRLSIRIESKNKQRFLEINLLIFVTLILASFLEYFEEYALSYFSIMLHEGGHIVSAILMGKRVYGIKILPLGINAYIDEGVLSSREKILMLLSGPFVNILLFLGLFLSAQMFRLDVEDIKFLLLMNVSLAVFNMIPVIPLDGGRILRELIAGKTGVFFAENLIRKKTFVISLLIIFAGIVQIILNPKNISLLIAGIYIFLLIISDKSEAALMNVKNIIFRRRRFLNKGIYPARGLVAVRSTRLIEAMKKMDYDRFHFVYILDDNMRLLKILTEQEVIDGMLKYNPDITFGDLLALESFK